MLQATTYNYAPTETEVILIALVSGGAMGLAWWLLDLAADRYLNWREEHREGWTPDDRQAEALAALSDVADDPMAGEDSFPPIERDFAIDRETGERVAIKGGDDE